MSSILIEKSKCIKCGTCVDECPSDVLMLKEDFVQEIHPKLCISCGHCAAICPNDAITPNEKNSHPAFVVKQMPVNISSDKLLFHKKRSIRTFKNDLLEKEQIEKLIEYAEKAPSAHNLRNRAYLVITKEEDIKAIRDRMIKHYKSLIKVLNPFALKLVSLFNKPAYNELSEYVLAFKHLIDEHSKGNDKIFRNSKCIICIAAPTGSPLSKDDCMASQHYMMLFGKTIDVDSFIVGYAQSAHRVIEKHLKLKKGYSVFSVSSFGFGKHKYSKEILYQKPEIKWS